MAEERELVTIQEAAIIAKVSRRTISSWMEKGKIEFTRTAGGSPRIYRDTLHPKPPPAQSDTQSTGTT